MAENIPESEAAKAALNNEEAPAEQEPVASDPPTGVNGDDDLDIEEIEEASGNELMSYAGAARDTYTLDLFLYREDSANNFFVTYKEVSDLVFRRLGVEAGMLVSVDTTPYKKITLELDSRVNIGNLNITQSLSVRGGLWTRPLQAPEKDRPVNIRWAPMKLPGKDIENVLKWFGEITESVENVVIRDTGNDDWTAMMDGVKTTDRKCRMKIKTNLPSIIMVRGIKLRVDYPGQPKTCSRCHKYWSVCPGGGKVDKCRDEGGEERDIKTVFKNLFTRVKRKEKGLPEEPAPVIPNNIPDPDMVKFVGFPEDFTLDEFKEWLNGREVNFLDPMVFKETKPGVFSIATVEEEGQEHKLEAEEAAEIVTKLNGIQFEDTNRRIMVTMLKLSTPEKKKPETITLDDSGEGQGATAAAPGGALPEDLVNVDTEESAEEADSDRDVESEKVKKSLKLNIAACRTEGGTKHLRVVGGKSRREESDTSLEASPELSKSQPQPRGRRGARGGAKATTQSQPPPDEKQTKPSKPAKKKSKQTDQPEK